MSLYFYCWINRRDGRTFRQAFATWKRFHMYRVPEGWTPRDLYQR